MVNAILNGSKSMTRRVVKFNESGRVKLKHKNWHIEDENVVLGCPYGQVGSKLWVRETFSDTYELGDYPGEALYKATYLRDWREYSPDPSTWVIKWKPSIFMRREYSRITLEITNIRVERLQEITEEEAGKEGIGRQVAHGQDLGWRNYLWHGDFGNYGTGNKQTDNWPHQYSTYDNAKGCFSSLWELINGTKYPWSSNPWVWVIEFVRLP
jgi:hypothetical protein